MQRVLTRVAAASAAALATAGAAQGVDVIGGQTSVALDFGTLESAAGLTLDSVSSDVISPGDLPDSVAFGINARDGSLPTTFSYESSDFLGTFSGTIEHSGSVLFNSGAIEVGDFTIGFDGARVGGGASGFFVESTAGLTGILFDVADPSSLSATDSALSIQADLLVSSEFAQTLIDAGLASSDLTGANVGEALVSANVPAPGAAGLAAVGLVAASRRRR